jgi:hypothetical protein
MISLSDEAAAQLFGLSCGYLLPSDVISWADRTILESRTVPAEITDIAIGPAVTIAIEPKLRALAGTFNPSPSVGSVIKSMRSVLELHPGRAAAVASGILHLSVANDKPFGAATDDARHVEYAFELVDDGVYGSYEDAVAELHAFLARWL